MSVALKSRGRKCQTPDWHARFLQMLPRIQKSASIAFSHLPPEARQEAIQDVTVAALIAFVRLFKLGKVHLAYPTVLARYAIAQHRYGRRMGTRLNVRDVSSPYAQCAKRFRVQHLYRFSRRQSEWREMLVEDKRATPAEIAAMRIDFATWMQTLSRQQRRYANLLASGESTTGTARKFGVSLGRVSQMRRELKQSWQAFQGECLDPDTTT